MPGHKRCGRGWWEGKFEGCGYRLTAARQTVVEALSGSKDHLSAEDIYMKIQKKYPGIGLATVYRTLDILTDLGIISKVDFGEGKARYELAHGPQGEQSAHHHLICQKCGKIINYSESIKEEDEFLTKAKKDLSVKYNFKITDHNIKFYGLCDKCADS